MKMEPICKGIEVSYDTSPCIILRDDLIWFVAWKGPETSEVDTKIPNLNALFVQNILLNQVEENVERIMLREHFLKNSCVLFFILSPPHLTVLGVSATPGQICSIVARLPDRFKTTKLNSGSLAFGVGLLAFNFQEHHI